MKKQLVFLALSAIVFFSCKTSVPPVATFTYEMQEDTVIFTNTSVGAISYSWDFGDNTSSTEKDPTHVYTTSGTYTVVLTANNEDASETYSETITVAKPIIRVDGDFADWDEVATDKLFTSTAADTATMKALETLKVCVDDNFIYFYLKLDSAKVAPIDIEINSDYVATTGSNSWLWNICGADYLMEGFLNVGMSDAAVYNFPATETDQTAWAWVNTVPAGSGVISMSTPKTVSGTVVEVEGKIIKELVTSQWANTIGFGVFTSDSSWAITGCLPGGGDKGDLLEVKLK